eukprot:142416-Rhodomonas_salina.3
MAWLLAVRESSQLPGRSKCSKANLWWGDACVRLKEEFSREQQSSTAAIRDSSTTVNGNGGPRDSSKAAKMQAGGMGGDENSLVHCSTARAVGCPGLTSRVLAGALGVPVAEPQRLLKRQDCADCQGLLSAQLLRMCCRMPGPDGACPALRLSCRARGATATGRTSRHASSSALAPRCPISGTDGAYAATRCAVLTARAQMYLKALDTACGVGDVRRWYGALRRVR